MRLGRQTHSLQCLALGDSRPALLDRTSCFSTTASTTTTIPRRCHSSLMNIMLRSIKYPVHKNSLKKTLEAQRTVNRESVIRKIYIGDQEDKVHTGEEQADNDGSKKSTEIKLLKTKKPKLPQAKDAQLPSAQHPWVLPLEDVGTQRRPWLDLIQQPSKQSGNAKSILGNEIAGLTAFLKPTSKEQETVNHILNDLSSQLRHVVPSAPQLVGSRKAELATSVSGIDLMIPVEEDHVHDSPRVKPPKITPEIRNKYIEILNQASETLRNHAGYRRYYIASKSSPSLSLFHRASDLPVRLFCRTDRSKLEEYIGLCLHELPSLRPLYMTMRILLESRSLFGWEKESFSSATLCLLIISFLKQQPEHFFAFHGLGGQLLLLLKTYGKQIDLTSTGISTSPADFFTESSVNRFIKGFISKHGTDKNSRQLPAYMIGRRALLSSKRHARSTGNVKAENHLCIQDPTSLLIDVGQRITRTQELQQAFSELHDELEVAVKRWDEGHRDDESILGQVLRADFGELLRRKRMLM